MNLVSKVIFFSSKTVSDVVLSQPYPPVLPILQIPVGGKERMESFPPLGSQDFTIKGIGWDTSAADVVLSSVGWVSVTAGVGSLVTVKAHTPNAVGLYIRQPALLPSSVQRRGELSSSCVLLAGWGREGKGKDETELHLNPRTDLRNLIS